MDRIRRVCVVNERERVQTGFIVLSVLKPGSDPTQQNDNGGGRSSSCKSRSSSSSSSSSSTTTAAAVPLPLPLSRHPINHITGGGEERKSFAELGYLPTDWLRASYPG